MHVLLLLLLMMMIQMKLGISFAVVNKTNRESDYKSIDVLLLKSPNVMTLTTNSSNNGEWIDSSIRVELKGITSQERTHLASPVNITFAMDKIDSNITPICMWQKDGMKAGHWNDSGCFTISHNPSHVTCVCTHVTTFTILKKFTTKSQQSISELLAQAKYRWTHTSFAFMFGVVMLYLPWHLFPIFMHMHKKQKNEFTIGLFVLAALWVHSWLQCLLCLLLIFVPLTNTSVSYFAIESIFAIVLVFSIILSFIILCAVLRSWIAISNPFDNSTSRQFLSLQYLYIGAFVILLLLVIVLLVLFFLRRPFFYIWETLMCIIVFIMAILYVYFGWKMHQVVSETFRMHAQMTANFSSSRYSKQNTENQQALTRIRVSIVTLLSYVFTQLVLNILSQDFIQRKELSWEIDFIDLFSNLSLLLGLLFVYHPQFAKMKLATRSIKYFFFYICVSFSRIYRDFAGLHMGGGTLLESNTNTNDPKGQEIKSSQT
ncbi:hypothetical protein RFI_20521 [Reticulomyxa filosa]|uniref:GAIN-B domain-containing protein n=1 Tax=Reticulomyxa filosa TaxID=46433 RepID=X6MSK2_RETFI|nr:hypothetical protein RFI_20521 [Reticulomyxa filosa]|eukprot:ETO16819.1 hypothetical protein RFI_20521 [Reticulomyxa filosa]